MVDFNDDVSLETRDGQPLYARSCRTRKSRLRGLGARAKQALCDAVNEGLNHLQLAHGDKRALIIVSDGGDNASQHAYGEVLALARRSQTVIYSIGLLGDSGEEENPGLLRRLCNDTWRHRVFPGCRGNCQERFRPESPRDLREQYTLGFAPGQKIKRQRPCFSQD